MVDELEKWSTTNMLRHFTYRRAEGLHEKTMSRNYYVYNLSAVELEVLQILATKRKNDFLLDQGPAFDQGMLLHDILAASSTFGKAAREKALASLQGKGEVEREEGTRRKPYRITEKAIARLTRFLENSVKDSKNDDTAAAPPQAAEEKTLHWLARMYAETMFPDESPKGSRSK
jgi:hypothetical protein